MTSPIKPEVRNRSHSERLNQELVALTENSVMRDMWCFGDMLAESEKNRRTDTLIALSRPIQKISYE